MNKDSNTTTPNGVCNRNVFKSIYVANLEQLRNYLYYKCGDLDEAEDIAQMAFMTLWEKCKVVIFEKAKSFVFTVANNLFLKKLRSDGVALKFIKEANTNINNDNPEDILISDELMNKIETVISELPEKQREVFSFE